MADRFVIRWPYDGHPSPLDPTSSAAWLEDTADGSLWFEDGGEPEDMILCRNLKAFVDAMNKYDADLTIVTAERDALALRLARLTAEVEAMRAVVDLAEQVTPRVPSSSNFGGSFQLRLALDALRARKVGG